VSSVGHRVLSISSANSSGRRRDASGSRFWFEDFQSVQHARSQTIQSCKHQAVNAIEGHPPRRFAPEHIELVSKVLQLVALGKLNFRYWTNGLARPPLLSDEQQKFGHK